MALGVDVADPVGFGGFFAELHAHLKILFLFLFFLGSTLSDPEDHPGQVSKPPLARLWLH